MVRLKHTFLHIKCIVFLGVLADGAFSQIKLFEKFMMLYQENYLCLTFSG